MIMVIDYTSTKHFFTIAKAEALAKRCNEADDQWTYAVEVVAEDKAVVKIIDEDGYQVGCL